MRKAIGGYEVVFFACTAFVLLTSSAAAAALCPRLHLHNGRMQYGMEHLAGALMGAFLFTLAVGLGWRFLLRTNLDGLLSKPASFYLLLVAFVFCLFWLPPLLAGHFDEDDWQLLAAAAIRKAIYLHPGWSWYALDSVDGNFRPLGTVLYFGYLYKWFGLWPVPYFAVLFAVNLMGSLTAFFLVREMGYSKLAGTAASLLYISRSLTYDIRTWPSALGDALVILLCGGMAWALLKATKLRGIAASGWYVFAWGCFCLATLAKQSAFAAPLIVALLLLLGPGIDDAGRLWPRVRSSLLGLAVYGGTAAVMFFHAKSLARAETPYPIGFSFASLLRTFSYAIWYFGTFEFPSKQVHWLWVVPSVVGVAIVLGSLAAIWRVPGVLGERPRDVVFCLGAAAASVSLFAVLSNRQAPYYGTMAAFWISVALGIALTRFEEARFEEARNGFITGRFACFVFCVLLVTGFIDVRLEQTGLFPSGGYTWGTYTGRFAEGMDEGIARQLAAMPEARVLVLADMPGNPSHNACMALLAAPRLKTILTYDSKTRQFFANDLQGDRPRDDFAALNDVHAYNWTVPVDAAGAARISNGGGVLWLKFELGKIVARN